MLIRAGLHVMFPFYGNENLVCCFGKLLELTVRCREVNLLHVQAVAIHVHKTTDSFFQGLQPASSQSQYAPGIQVPRVRLDNLKRVAIRHSLKQIIELVQLTLGDAVEVGIQNLLQCRGSRLGKRKCAKVTA